MEKFPSQVGGGRLYLRKKIGGGGCLAQFSFFFEEIVLSLFTNTDKIVEETNAGGVGVGRGLDVGMTPIRNSECFY